MLSDFVTGLGPANRDFGPNSARSQQMMSAYGLAQNVNNFLAGGASSGNQNFGLGGLASSGLNPTAQFVGLTCSGAPPNSTCSISPPALTLDGTHDGNATVTVGTHQSARMLGSAVDGAVFKHNGKWNFALAASVALFALCFAGHVPNRHSRTRIVSVLMLPVLGCLFLVACGGGGSNGGGGGTSPGTCTITVTASGGSFNHSAKFTLNIN